MSPNDSCFNFDEILPLSSVSTDSESLFEVDVKNSDGQVDHQWDIIERTLYQEPGPQVTDQELLKECKLWRDTFPHIRVTGTKIDVKDYVETDQSVQTANNYFDVKKLNEKRESIKKKVVGELVERLIAKFSINKKTEGKSNVLITEISDDEIDSKKMITSPPSNEKINKEFRSFANASTERESYFERGKPKCKESVGLSKEQAEKGLLEILNQRDKGEFTSFKNLPKLIENSGKARFIEKDDFDLRTFDRQAERRKPKRTIPPSDSVTNMFKPFKMVSKIDKKHEGLLGEIIERRLKQPDRSKHCRTSSGMGIQNCQESLEKLRLESGFNFRKNLPKIKFNNNWLDRGDLNAFYETEEEVPLRRNTIRNKKLSKDLDLFREETDIDDFIENVKREMSSSLKREPRKSGPREGINLRSKPFKAEERAERSAKSWSCSDLPKKEKKEAKSRQMKSGLEKSNELNFKSRSKLTNSSNGRGTKASGNKNTLLPPIESGIICTELTGRPKIGPKALPKRL